MTEYLGFLALLTLDSGAQAAFEDAWSSRPAGIQCFFGLGSVDLVLFVPGEHEGWLEWLIRRVHEGQTGGQVRSYFCRIFGGAIPPVRQMGLLTLGRHPYEGVGTWESDGFYRSINLRDGTLSTNARQLIDWRRTGSRTFSIPVLPYAPEVGAASAWPEEDRVLATLVASVRPGYESAIGGKLAGLLSNAAGGERVGATFTHGSRDLVFDRPLRVDLSSLTSGLWHLRKEHQEILAVRTHTPVPLPLGEAPSPGEKGDSDPFSPYFVPDLVHGRDWSSRMAEARAAVGRAERAMNATCVRFGIESPAVSIKAVVSYGNTTHIRLIDVGQPRIEVVFSEKALRSSQEDWEQVYRHEAATAAAFGALAMVRAAPGDGNDPAPRGFYATEGLGVSPAKAAEVFSYDLAEMVGTAVTLILGKRQNQVNPAADLLAKLSGGIGGPIAQGHWLRLLGGLFLARRAQKLNDELRFPLDLSWLNDVQEAKKILGAAAFDGMKMSPCTLARWLLVEAQGHLVHVAHENFAPAGVMLSIAWRLATVATLELATAFSPETVPTTPGDPEDGPRNEQVLMLLRLEHGCDEALSRCVETGFPDGSHALFEERLRPDIERHRERAVVRALELIGQGKPAKTWPISAHDPRADGFMEPDTDTPVGWEVFAKITVGEDLLRYPEAQARLGVTEVVGRDRGRADLALELHLETEALKSAQRFPVKTGEIVSFNLPPWLLQSEPGELDLVGEVERVVKRIQAKGGVPVIELVEGASDPVLIRRALERIQGHVGNVGVAFDDTFSNGAGVGRMIELVQIAAALHLSPVIVKIDQSVIRSLLLHEAENAGVVIAGLVAACTGVRAPNYVIVEGGRGWSEAADEATRTAETTHHKQWVRAVLQEARKHLPADAPKLLVQG